MPPEDDEDYIDMGGAILTFYSALIDLMGRCAPDAETLKTGRSDSLRARAILRSLVSMDDLEGVLGLRFILPVSKGEVNEAGKCGMKKGPTNAYKDEVMKEVLKYCLQNVVFNPKV